MLAKLHIKLERWKYNKTFEVYVSNMGHVKNKSKALLAPKISRDGYVHIHVDGSKPGFITLHRLVMLTWCPTPEAENLTVDHLDHNKRNNAVDNLEWVTKEENLRRAEEDLLIIDSKVRTPFKVKVILGVRCTDQTGKTIDVMDNTDKSEVASDLYKCPGFKYETFCNRITEVRQGKVPARKYCGITITPIRGEKEV